MTSIICSVEECTHNNNEVCYHPEIVIGVFPDSNIPRCTTFEYKEETTKEG